MSNLGESAQQLVIKWTNDDGLLLLLLISLGILTGSQLADNITAATLAAVAMASRRWSGVGHVCKVRVVGCWGVLTDLGAG